MFSIHNTFITIVPAKRAARQRPSSCCPSLGRQHSSAGLEDCGSPALVPICAAKELVPSEEEKFVQAPLCEPEEEKFVQELVPSEDGDLSTRASSLSLSSESREELLGSPCCSSFYGHDGAGLQLTYNECYNECLQLTCHKVGRTALKACKDGRLWKPIGGVFQEEVLKLAREVAGELQGTFGGLQAWPQFWSHSRDHGVCTLVATVNSKDAETSGDAIQAAVEEDVLNRCSKTRGVCLLGFKQEPFTRMPHGFSTTFANVCSKRRHCRDLYRDGYCRKSWCGYEHPSSTVSFNFVIAIDDAAVDLMINTGT